MWQESSSEVISADWSPETSPPPDFLDWGPGLPGQGVRSRKNMTDIRLVMTLVSGVWDPDLT